MTTHINQPKIFLYLIPTCLLGIYFIMLSSTKPIGDFGNYYYASKFLLNGNWGQWIYEPSKFNLAVYELGQRDFFINYTPVPPFSAILYLPFSIMQVSISKLIWDILTFSFFIFSVIKLQTHLKFNHRILLFIPLIIYTPLRNGLYEGQSYLLLFSLLSLGFIFYQTDKLLLAALFWSLCIHLKISPAFVLFFLLFQKDIKAIIYLIICTLSFIIISIPFIGFSVWQHYLLDIIPRLFNGEINNTYAISYQSMQVLLKTMLVPDLMHNHFAWFNNPTMYKKLSIFFITLIYGITILCSLTKSSKESKFSLWLITSLLVSGYGNSFSMLLLLIPSLLLYHQLILKPTLSILFLFCLIITINLPIHFFANDNMLTHFPRLYGLIILFILSISLIEIRFKYYYLIPLLIIYFIPYNNTVYAQNYLFDKEEALLIYDFKTNERSITIHFFDNNGPQYKTIFIPHKFEGRKVTYDTTYFHHNDENIIKSCSINDSIYIYLSDKNRGVGFYTIRFNHLKKYSY